MDQKELEYLRRIEDHAAQTGWVAPLTQEDKAYFAYLRQVSKRYNINMSKANRLEYDFVIRVAESEFYLHNLALVTGDVHKLVHATDPVIIRKYLEKLKNCKLNMVKLNKFRLLAGNCKLEYR